MMYNSKWKTMLASYNKKVLVKHFFQIFVEVKWCTVVAGQLASNTKDLTSSLTGKKMLEKSKIKS